MFCKGNEFNFKSKEYREILGSFITLQEWKIYAHPKQTLRIYSYQIFRKVYWGQILARFGSKVVWTGYFQGFSNSKPSPVLLRSVN